MSKYKVGDRVRVVAVGESAYGKRGEIGTVVEVREVNSWSYCYVRFEGDDFLFYYNFDDVELAEKPLIDIEFEEKHKDDVMDAVRYAFHKLSGLAEEPIGVIAAIQKNLGVSHPNTATDRDTLDSIADILQDYMDSGRLTELAALNAINKRLAEHFIGYGAEPPELVRCVPDDSPDDADTPTVAEPDDLKVGDYVRVIAECDDERYQDIGKVILTLANDHCFVRFEDKEEIPYHKDNIEKLAADEPHPEIKSSLEERAEAEKKPKIGTIEMVFPEEKKQEIIEEIKDAYMKFIYDRPAVEPDPKIALHKQITEELNRIYESKNHDYGDSFQEAYREFGLISAVIRITDKVNRLKSLCTKGQLVADESIKDTLMDCANYCIMTLIALEESE